MQFFRRQLLAIEQRDLRKQGSNKGDAISLARCTFGLDQIANRCLADFHFLKLQKIRLFLDDLHELPPDVLLVGFQ